jgi:hypothetical protein
MRRRASLLARSLHQQQLSVLDAVLERIFSTTRGVSAGTAGCLLALLIGLVADYYEMLILYWLGGIGPFHTGVAVALMSASRFVSAPPSPARPPAYARGPSRAPAL